MTLIIDLPPDKESALRMAAAHRGMEPEAYALWLVETSLPAGNSETTLSLEEAERLLDSLADESPDTPTLPDEANSRAYYYQDHD